MLQRDTLEQRPAPASAQIPYTVRENTEAEQKCKRCGIAHAPRGTTLPEQQNADQAAPKSSSRRDIPRGMTLRYSRNCTLHASKQNRLPGPVPGNLVMQSTCGFNVCFRPEPTTPFYRETFATLTNPCAPVNRRHTTRT